VAGPPRRSQLELTPALEHAICTLVANGIPLVDASRALGLGPRTVYRWVQWGRHANGHAPIYARFVDGVDAAQTERAYHVEQLLARAAVKTRR